jgi:Thaumatin family
MRISLFFLFPFFQNIQAFTCFCKTTQLTNTTSTSVCDCPAPSPTSKPSRKPSISPTTRPSIRPTTSPSTTSPSTTSPSTTSPSTTTNEKAIQLYPTTYPIKTPSKTIPYDICPDGITRCSGNQYCPDGSLCASGTLISYDPILEVINYCPFPIWIFITGGAVKGNPVLPKITKIPPNNSQAYNAKGWNGRVNTNHSRYPSLAEFNFGRTIWYDISLVDAFDGIPIYITTSTSTCANPACNLTLTECPTGNLKDDSSSCLSPCSLTHLPEMCCGSLTPEQCRAGPVVNTSYVQLVNQRCPLVYAYSYDDSRGLHTCAGDTNIVISYCGTPPPL